MSPGTATFTTGQKKAGLFQGPAPPNRDKQRLLAGPCHGRKILYPFPIAPFHHGNIITAILVVTTLTDSLVLGLDPRDGYCAHGAGLGSGESQRGVWCLQVIVVVPSDRGTARKPGLVPVTAAAIPAEDDFDGLCHSIDTEQS